MPVPIIYTCLSLIFSNILTVLYVSPEVRHAAHVALLRGAYMNSIVGFIDAPLLAPPPFVPLIEFPVVLPGELPGISPNVPLPFSPWPTCAMTEAPPSPVVFVEEAVFNGVFGYNNFDGRFFSVIVVSLAALYLYIILAAVTQVNPVRPPWDFFRTLFQIRHRLQTPDPRNRTLYHQHAWNAWRQRYIAANPDEFTTQEILHTSQAALDAYRQLQDSSVAYLTTPNLITNTGELLAWEYAAALAHVQTELLALHTRLTSTHAHDVQTNFRYMVSCVIIRFMRSKINGLLEQLGISAQQLSVLNKDLTQSRRERVLDIAAFYNRTTELENAQLEAKSRLDQATATETNALAELATEKAKVAAAAEELATTKFMVKELNVKLDLADKNVEWASKQQEQEEADHLLTAEKLDESRAETRKSDAELRKSEAKLVKARDFYENGRKDLEERIDELETLLSEEKASSVEVAEELRASEREALEALTAKIEHLEYLESKLKKAQSERQDALGDAAWLKQQLDATTHVRDEELGEAEEAKLAAKERESLLHQKLECAVATIGQMKNALGEQQSQSAPAQGLINDAQAAELGTAVSKANAKLAVQAKELADNAKLLEELSQIVQDDTAEKKKLASDITTIQQERDHAQQVLNSTEVNFSKLMATHKEAYEELQQSNATLCQQLSDARDAAKLAAPPASSEETILERIAEAVKEVKVDQTTQILNATEATRVAEAKVVQLEIDVQSAKDKAAILEKKLASKKALLLKERKQRNDEAKEETVSTETALVSTETAPVCIDTTPVPNEVTPAPAEATDAVTESTEPLQLRQELREAQDSLRAEKEAHITQVQKLNADLAKEQKEHEDRVEEYETASDVAQKNAAEQQAKLQASLDEALESSTDLRATPEQTAAERDALRSELAAKTHDNTTTTDNNELADVKDALRVAKHNANEFEKKWETALELVQRLQAEKNLANLQAKQPKDDGKSSQRKSAKGKMAPALPVWFEKEMSEGSKKVGTKPAEDKPVEIQPAVAQPEVIQPEIVQPVVIEPAKEEPAKEEPAKKEPQKVEPPKVEPPKVEPAEIEPAEVQPAEIPPVETKPVETKPAATKPANRPVLNMSASIYAPRVPQAPSPFFSKQSAQKSSQRPQVPQEPAPSTMERFVPQSNLEIGLEVHVINYQNFLLLTSDDAGWSFVKIRKTVRHMIRAMQEKRLKSGKDWEHRTSAPMEKLDGEALAKRMEGYAEKVSLTMEAAVRLLDISRTKQYPLRESDAERLEALTVRYRAILRRRKEEEVREQEEEENHKSYADYLQEQAALRATAEAASTAEAPVAEAPVAEAPVAEAPVAEAPVPEFPASEVPVVKFPSAQASTPAVDSSNLTVPENIEVPEVPRTSIAGLVTSDQYAHTETVARNSEEWKNFNQWVSNSGGDVTTSRWAPQTPAAGQIPAAATPSTSASRWAASTTNALSAASQTPAPAPTASRNNNYQNANQKGSQSGPWRGDGR